MEYPLNTEYVATWPFLFYAATGTVTVQDTVITSSTLPFRLRATDSNTTTLAYTNYDSTLTLVVAADCANMTKLTSVAAPAAKSLVETTATSTVSWSLSDFFTIDAACTT